MGACRQETNVVSVQRSAYGVVRTALKDKMVPINAERWTLDAFLTQYAERRTLKKERFNDEQDQESVNFFK